MRAALAAVCFVLTCAACTQAAPSAGFDEFNRICLEPHTLDFTLSGKDEERLGLQKDPIRFMPDDLAKKYDVPESERVLSYGPPYLFHGYADDPYAFAIWYRPQKSTGTVQRVDAGRSWVGVKGNSAAAHFCSVLTMSNAEKAKQAFVAAMKTAIPLYEKRKNWLFGNFQVWQIDLPWEPGQTGIVTIADMTSAFRERPASMPDAALFVIEVVATSEFQRFLARWSNGDRG